MIEPDLFDLAAKVIILKLKAPSVRGKDDELRELVQTWMNSSAGRPTNWGTFADYHRAIQHHSSTWIEEEIFTPNIWGVAEVS